MTRPSLVRRLAVSFRTSGLSLETMRKSGVVLAPNGVPIESRGSKLKMKRILALALVFGAALFSAPAMAADGGNCPRPAEGSDVRPPPDLYSSNGVLNVSLKYWTSLDDAGRTLFCFVTDDGLESPTLHVNPGDTINISLTNMLPQIPGGPEEIVSANNKVCGSPAMKLTSVNMHFHGINTSPKCHSDEVIHTLINSGQSFAYAIKIPKDEPPGLYWYHPHIHGISSQAVQGGASGAIIVEGIQNIQPAVAGLPERLLIIRDQQRTGHHAKGIPAPSWDVSLNYIPINYPEYNPAIIKMKHGAQEFWRVANASANTIIDLQLLYDGKPQPLQIVALDGVPTGSHDGKRQGTIITQKDILLPPAGRAEFIVMGPSRRIQDARLITRKIHGGPASDSNPARPLAVIHETKSGVEPARMPERSGPPGPQRFDNLMSAKVTARRKLYFYEVPARFPGKGEAVKFYIVVDGQFAHLYSPDNPPDIVTTRGAVEDWIIENRTNEVHEFHMHQIHFLLLAVNGIPVPKEKRQFYDTFQVPYWNGVGKYPSIKVRMDFRGAVVGDFVYHCHILDHEDGGMMAIIRVKPPKS